MRFWLITTLLAALIFCACANAAFAQQSFVPITITEQDVQQLQAYFRTNTPPAYSEPVLKWLSDLEQRAVTQEKAKKEAEKKPDAKQKP